MTNSKLHKSFLLVSLMIALVSCDAPSSAIPTSIPTPSPAPTATTMPTVTPKAGIDLEMFHKIPASQEYLEAHLEEFVQAPDPVTQRAVFDKWFTEQLLPALGQKSERTLNILNKGGGGGHAVWVQYINKGTALTSQPPFFWFENNGVIYGVPCITTTTVGYEDVSIITMCPALFDSSALMYGTRAFEALTNGQGIHYIQIFYNPQADRPDLDWGDAQALVTSVGDYPLDDNGVKFGFGCIEFYKK